MGFLFGEASGPEAVDEHTGAVLLGWFFVDAFQGDLHGDSLLVAGEVFGADVWGFYACVLEEFLHGGHHFGWAVDVVDGDGEIGDVFFEHGFVDGAGLAAPGLGGFLHLGHGGDEVEVWIFLLGLGEVAEEGGVFGAAVGVDEEDFLSELGAGCFEDHASHRSDADAACDENGRGGVLFMQGEFTPERFEGGLGSEGDGSQPGTPDTFG